ncbi:MAG TPA: oxidoreductase [Gemmatimonadaceae bacterium]|nr:oxidoreductase [Gemmatimonadaceae bacterium]
MPSLLIAGATGLVGRECLALALADPAFERVVVIARKPASGVASPKLDWRVADFRQLEMQRSAFEVDAILCALGTTIKVAGSQERFREVDHDYPLALARMGLAAGARHCLLVSALGADATSRIFYNRVKGETERDILALGFPRITIARPSLLLGEREEFRLGERVAQLFAWAVPGKYRPIEARVVAKALIDAARGGGEGRRVLESSEMRGRGARG